MLTETFFTIADASEIETSAKKFKRISNLFILVSFPADLILAWFTSKKYPTLFWPAVAACFLLSISVYYFVFMKGLRRVAQELNEQIKLVGQTKVVSKTNTDKVYSVGLESPDPERLYVTEKAFQQIDIGDDLYVEVSNTVNHIFKLSKNGQSLLES